MAQPADRVRAYIYLSRRHCAQAQLAGEVRNVSLLVAIGVNSEGYRDILGICEGAKEDKAGWSAFLKHLKERGLSSVRLIISDACMGLAESAAEFFPDAAWQRRLTRAAELAEAGVEETLTYYAFPEEHWRRIRTNNPLERILREIRRRTRVVGASPDGQSALNLAAARLRHIAGTTWSANRYLNIELLKDQQMRGAIPT
jgi:putative transposase